MKDEYIRAVKVIEVHDADGVKIDIDLGWYLWARMSCRLTGLNGPELSEPGGIEVRDFLREQLVGKSAVVQSKAPDKYAGRFDGILVLNLKAKKELNVNLLLVNRGFAVPWDGKGLKPKVPWPPVPPVVPFTTLPTF